MIGAETLVEAATPPVLSAISGSAITLAPGVELRAVTLPGFEGRMLPPGEPSIETYTTALADELTEMLATANLESMTVADIAAAMHMPAPTASPCSQVP